MSIWASRVFISPYPPYVRTPHTPHDQVLKHGITKHHPLDGKERRSDIEISTPADIWSLGVLAYEVVTGELPPFAGASAPDLLTLINAKVLTTERFGIEYADFMLRCLALDPAQRPRASELLRHPLFARYVESDKGAESPWKHPLKKSSSVPAAVMKDKAALGLPPAPSPRRAPSLAVRERLPAPLDAADSSMDRSMDDPSMSPRRAVFTFLKNHSLARKASMNSGGATDGADSGSGGSGGASSGDSPTRVLQRRPPRPPPQGGEPDEAPGLFSTHAPSKGRGAVFAKATVALKAAPEVAPRNMMETLSAPSPDPSALSTPVKQGTGKDSEGATATPPPSTLVKSMSMYGLLPRTPSRVFTEFTLGNKSSHHSQLSTSPPRHLGASPSQSFSAPSPASSSSTRMLGRALTAASLLASPSTPSVAQRQAPEGPSPAYRLAAAPPSRAPRTPLGERADLAREGGGAHPALALAPSLPHLGRASVSASASLSAAPPHRQLEFNSAPVTGERAEGARRRLMANDPGAQALVPSGSPGRVAAAAARMRSNSFGAYRAAGRAEFEAPTVANAWAGQ